MSSPASPRFWGCSWVARTCSLSPRLFGWASTKYRGVQNQLRATSSEKDRLLLNGSCNKLASIKEIVFEITQESDGGFVAECLTESIITQADDWEELRANVKEAVAAFYFDQPERPSSIRLHLVRDEILAYA